MNRKLVELDLNSITIKTRPRHDNGDLSTLENSIRKLGLLCPIIVDRNNVLIAGGRRLAACRNAGITTIPALRLDIEFNSMAALDIQSDENLCRQPLSPEELEKHIQMKKSRMTGTTTSRTAGTFSWFKKLFSPKSK